MYLTLLGIGIISLIIGIIWGVKEEWYDGPYIAPLVIGAFLTIIFVIVSVINFAEIAKIERTVESRIELYESYNEEIKTQVDAVSMQYLDHESDIYNNFNSTEILLIVPELHSNTIIMEQIALYEANELKLLELREQKIDLQFKKFMLYWGS